MKTERPGEQSVTEACVCRVDKDADEEQRSACKGLDFYAEHKGKRYCVLHFPSTEKGDDFRNEIERKLEPDNKDFNFACVYFPEDQSFESCEFPLGANFSKAFFEGDANFDGATFHGDANFHATTFKGNACFREATFKGAATFWEARFLRDACFNRAKFLDRAQFSARRCYRAFNLKRAVNFDYVGIEKPELCAFNSLRLRPSWFIYVEKLQELKFHEVQWYGLREGPRPREQDEAIAFRGEADALQNRKGKGKGCQHDVTKNISQPYQLLARTYRRLSRNYEDNREYPIANEFHYWSMDATRRRDWSFFEDLSWRDLRKWESWPAIVRHFGLITTLYFLLSGYGVRAARAFWVLAGMCAAFAVLYIMFGPPKLQDLAQAVVYSLGAAARLNPEPRPNEPGLFQFLVIAEGLLGPLQIGLLLLALRRKVMR